jgi:hypothetical protein
LYVFDAFYFALMVMLSDLQAIRPQPHSAWIIPEGCLNPKRSRQREQAYSNKISVIFHTEDPI